MPQTLEATPPISTPLELEASGEWQAWDAKWPDIGRGPHRMLFTLDQPQTPQARRLRAYWRMLEPMASPEYMCIELGSGRGTISQYLCSLSCRVVLVDLSDIALQIAKENFKQCGMPPPLLVNADCRHTELLAESADIVHSVGLLEHFARPLPVLEEAARLLKPGGLNWHVIVGGDAGANGMFRANYAPAQYELWMRQAGLRDPLCHGTIFPGILIAMARK